MPAPDYRDWTIIGHNGVPTAGCSINLPVMQRPDGTITLLSLGPFGVLSRDTREDVEEFAKQGLLTLFPDGIHVALPPEAEGCQEDYPTVLSISQGFAHEVNPGKGDLPKYEDLRIPWTSLASSDRWVVCLRESEVKFLRDHWGEMLREHFDAVFVQTETCDCDWDRLLKIAKFGLEIAMRKGLREYLYRRCCMAVLQRPSGAPEAAKGVFEVLVEPEFPEKNWVSFKAEIEGLHQDLLMQRSFFFQHRENEDTIQEFRQSRSAANDPSQTRQRRAERRLASCGLSSVESVRPISSI